MSTPARAARRRVALQPGDLPESDLLSLGAELLPAAAAAAELEHEPREIQSDELPGVSSQQEEPPREERVLSYDTAPRRAGILQKLRQAVESHGSQQRGGHSVGHGGLFGAPYADAGRDALVAWEPCRTTVDNVQLPLPGAPGLAEALRSTQLSPYDASHRQLAPAASLPALSRLRRPADQQWLQPVLEQQACQEVPLASRGGPAGQLTRGLLLIRLPVLAEDLAGEAGGRPAGRRRRSSSPKPPR